MKKLNVILVYPDQLRYDALSCNGNKICQTPRMDMLADEGANFKKSYSSYPLCCPFRASLMTGLYPHNNGMYSNHYPLATDLPHYLPNIMKENGDSWTKERTQLPPDFKPQSIAKYEN